MLKVHDLNILKQILPHTRNVLISGSPGIGKSEITYQIAEDLGLKVLEVRLYEYGETAIGLPKLSGDKMEWALPDWFVELQSGHYDILFLDDFHLVPPQLQKFLYKLLTSRQLHSYHINHDIKVILAGNFNIKSASSNNIQSPVMSRLDIAIEYEPDVNQFLNWAYRSGRFHNAVLGFIKLKPEFLYTNDPGQTEMYPCPRTWEYLSKLLDSTNDPHLAVGVVGKTVGGIFVEFWDSLTKSVEDVLVSQPSSTKDQVVAVIILGQNIENIVQNGVLEKAQDFIRKLPHDIQFLFGLTAYNKTKKAIDILLQQFPDVAENIINL